MEGGATLGKHEGEVQHGFKQFQCVDALVMGSLAEHQPELLGLLACPHAVSWLAGRPIATSELEVVKAALLHTAQLLHCEARSADASWPHGWRCISAHAELQLPTLNCGRPSAHLTRAKGGWQGANSGSTGVDGDRNRLEMMRVLEAERPHLDAGHRSHSQLLNTLAGIVINSPCLFLGPPSILHAPSSVQLAQLSHAIHTLSMILCLLCVASAAADTTC